MADIQWNQTAVKLSQLQPWEGNPKTSTAKNAKQLKDSVEELGQFQDVAIGPFNGDGKAPVYDGHQRLSAWLHAYGMDYEVTAKQSSRPLTEQERRKVAIYSRQIGAWDWDVLSGWEPAELTEWGFDDDLLNDWRRDVAALGDFLESEEEPEQGDAEPQTNRADELRELWGVESGQMWRLPSRVEGQEHRLICGDCTDEAVVSRVMGEDNADIEIHDPPYGMNLDTDYSNMPSTKAEGNKTYKKVHGDDVDFNASELLNTETKELFLWGADYYAETIPCKNEGAWMVWDKRVTENFDAMIGSAFELVWSRQRHKRQIIRHNNTLFSGESEAKDKLHPTQKPTAVYTWLLEKYSKVGNITVDYYLGAASHLIAAENLSRQCRAVEISPAYVAVALQRYQDAFGITPELIKED